MRRGVAAITMFRGDHFWLQIWLRHYEKLLGGRENLFVILHGGDATARAMLEGVSQINVPLFIGDAAFEKRRMRFIHSFAAGLLQYFARIVFVDTDEMLCLHPDAGDNFGRYVEEHTYGGKALSSVGIELLAKEGSPALDPGQSILGQCNRGVVSGGYCKPNVFFQPIGRANQHRIPGEPLTIDRNLLLFHLRYADHERFLTTSEERRAYAGSTNQVGAKRVGGWDDPVSDYYRKLEYFENEDPVELTKENLEPVLQRFERTYRRKGRPGGRSYGHFIVPEAIHHLV